MSQPRDWNSVIDKKNHKPNGKLEERCPAKNIKRAWDKSIVTITKNRTIHSVFCFIIIWRLTFSYE